AVIARVIGRRSRASGLELRTYLSGHQKGRGVSFVGREDPCDAVAFVDPDFVRQECQHLLPLVDTLSAGDRAQLIGGGRTRLTRQDREQQHRIEHALHIPSMDTYRAAIDVLTTNDWLMAEPNFIS